MRSIFIVLLLLIGWTANSQNNFAGNGRHGVRLWRWSRVCIELQETAALSLTVFDLSGNVLWKQNYPGLATGKHQLSLNGFLQAVSKRNTVYILRVDAAGKLLYQKIIH